MLARMLTTILLFLCVFQSMQVDEVVPLVVHMTVKKNTLSPTTVDQTYRKPSIMQVYRRMYTLLS